MTQDEIKLVKDCATQLFVLGVSKNDASISENIIMQEAVKRAKRFVEYLGTVEF